MSQSKIVFAVALSLLLCVCLNIGASDDEDSGGKRGLHGVQEFFVSGSFAVPKNVTHVMVTMWGAGGGSGAGVSTNCQEGGAGGGGAYTNTVVRVTPGATYNVTVGVGGTGGLNTGDNGTDGSDSQFSLNSTVLAFAGGGKAGTAAPSSVDIGISGSGGQADSTAQISHSPNSAVNSFAYAYNLAPDMRNVGSTALFLGSLIGGGGAGSCGSGASGTQGYVLLTY